MTWKHGTIAVITAIWMFAVQSDIALAYVGPGTGITLVGSLLALLFAVLLAIAGILFWPVRALLRRRRNARRNRDRSAPSDTNRSDA